MLKLVYHRNIYQQLSRGKIASRGSQGTKKSSRSSGLHAAKPKTTMPHRKGEQGAGVLWKRVQIQAKNVRGSAEYKLVEGRTSPRSEPWRQSATGEIELGQSTDTEENEGGRGGELGVPERMEEGLHGCYTLGGKLPPKVQIKPNHRAKERHCTAHERNVIAICPALNAVRDRQVRAPQNRGLGKREGKAKRWRQSGQALKENGDLLKRTDSGDVINVCRHSKIIEAMRCFLKNGLQAETKEECAQYAALARPPLRCELATRPSRPKRWRGEGMP